jgi:hypothetical protein
VLPRNLRVGTPTRFKCSLNQCEGSVRKRVDEGLLIGRDSVGPTVDRVRRQEAGFNGALSQRGEDLVAVQFAKREEALDCRETSNVDNRACWLLYQPRA